MNSLGVNALLFFLGGSAWAETPPEEIAAPPVAPPVEAPSTPPPAVEDSSESDFGGDEFLSGDSEPAPSPRSGRGEDRDAEGTRAKDRFSVPEVRRSPYQFKGKPLEVDPD